MRYLFLQYPVLGVGSVRAAIAAECSAAQGRFWDYHKALFQAAEREGRSVFSGGRLVTLAGEIGLDVDRLVRCSTEQRRLDAVWADLEAAIALGAGSTPTIFINGTAYEGVRTFDFYRTRIEEILANN